MKVDSPSDLETAFARWRRSKRHLREAVPEELLERGPQVDRGSWSEGGGPFNEAGAFASFRGTKVEAVARKRRRVRSEAIPSSSRFELTAPSTSSGPLVEIETPAGMKVRIFSETPAALALLSSLCGGGST